MHYVIIFCAIIAIIFFSILMMDYRKPKGEGFKDDTIEGAVSGVFGTVMKREPTSEELFLWAGEVRSAKVKVDELVGVLEKQKVVDGYVNIYEPTHNERIALGGASISERTMARPNFANFDDNIDIYEDSNLLMETGGGGGQSVSGMINAREVSNLAFQCMNGDDDDDDDDDDEAENWFGM